MTTERKIISNRRNSLRSTGPRTDAGRARSSLNAFKHGLRARRIVVLSSEYADACEFVATTWADLAPVGAAEEIIADLAIRELIRTERAHNIEVGLLRRCFSLPKGTYDLVDCIAAREGRSFEEAAKRAVSVRNVVIGKTNTSREESRQATGSPSSESVDANQSASTGSAPSEQKRRSIERRGVPTPDSSFPRCPIRVVTPKDI